jgi:hypothetical protein
MANLIISGKYDIQLSCLPDIIKLLRVIISKSIATCPAKQQLKGFCPMKGENMDTELTGPISIYMDSINSNDSSILEKCIAKDAHVHDAGENNHINGLEAIKNWRGGSNDEFKLNSEVTAVEEKYGIIIVISIASGNFPSSPHIFYYFFTVADDLITNIEIIPGEENIKV